MLDWYFALAWYEQFGIGIALAAGLTVACEIIAYRADIHDGPDEPYIP